MATALLLSKALRAPLAHYALESDLGQDQVGVDMLWKVVTFLALASIGGAAAEECIFASAGGDRLSFPSPITIELRSESGTVSCSTSSGGTGVSMRVAHCDDGYEGPVVSATSVKGGSDYDLVIFKNELWYRTCE